MSRASDQTLAAAFFTLGDPIRISIVTRLATEGAMSATVLSRGDDRVTRQAIVKHLQVLMEAGLVGNQRFGREVRYGLEPDGLDDARVYLDVVRARLSKLGRGRPPRKTRRRAPATRAR